MYLELLIPNFQFEMDFVVPFSGLFGTFYLIDLTYLR